MQESLPNPAPGGRPRRTDRRRRPPRPGRVRAAIPAHPSGRETVYSDEEEAYLAAVAAWQALTRTRFPSPTQLLGVARGMGYVLVPHGYRLVALADEWPLRLVR